LTQGPPAATYGLVVLDRAGSSQDNVALVVGADGRWALLRYQNHRAPALVFWRHTAPLRRGHNTPNELQLALLPGHAGHPASFTVTINGRTVAAHVPAWTSAPTGRVGLLAGPGAEVVADSLSVSPPAPSKVTLEDHFLNNRLAWTLGGAPGGSPVDAGVLYVGPAIGVPWRIALPHHLVFPPLPTTVTDELTATVRAAALLHARQAGGLVFARALLGHRAPMLVALIDLQSNVSIVALSGTKIRTLVGPVPDPALRMGLGLNTLRVRTTFTRSSITAQVLVNGQTVAHYSGANPGVEPAAGMVTIGDVGLNASALRLYGRGIHL
ncbi:MAG TPA: hypothetical protein VHB98_00540, partial [Chloroflexota bacterium]|nr:hypothetical protein [Chloroflexota bacterium]